MSDPRDISSTPKPSLLMLWLARLYAVFALSLSLFRFVSFSREPDTVAINYSPAPAEMTGNMTTVVAHHATSNLFVGTLLWACLAFGLSTLNRKSGQRIVLAAAIASIGLNFYGVSHLLYMMALSNTLALHHAPLGEVFAGSACSLVIQLGNIWLALRPPISNERDENNLPPFSSAQPI
jgi:hypothetical protein